MTKDESHRCILFVHRRSREFERNVAFGQRVDELLKVGAGDDLLRVEQSTAGRQVAEANHLGHNGAGEGRCNFTLG